jgi:hypothetical protein
MSYPEMQLSAVCAEYCNIHLHACNSTDTTNITVHLAKTVSQGDASAVKSGNAFFNWYDRGMAKNLAEFCGFSQVSTTLLLHTTTLHVGALLLYHAV